MGLVPATPNLLSLFLQQRYHIRIFKLGSLHKLCGTFSARRWSCSPLEQSCRILVDFGFCAILQMVPTAISCGQNIVRSRPAVDVSWPSTSKWTAMSRWKMIMMFWNLWWRKLGKQFLEEHAWVTAEFENYVYISVLGKCQRLFSWLIHYIYILYNLFFVQISTR